MMLKCSDLAQEVPPDTLKRLDTVGDGRELPQSRPRNFKPPAGVSFHEGLTIEDRSSYGSDFELRGGVHLRDRDFAAKSNSLCNRQDQTHKWFDVQPQENVPQAAFGSG